LAALFGELAYNQIHDISKRAGWKDADPRKATLHAIVGGIMAKLGDSNFLAGASGAAVNELMQKELSKIKDPALHQWASAAVGAAVGGIVGGKHGAQSGASTAAMGTKENMLDDTEWEAYLKEIKEAMDNENSRSTIGSLQRIKDKYGEKSDNNKQKLAICLLNKEFKEGLIKAMKDNPKLKYYKGILVSGHGTKSQSYSAKDWMMEVEWDKKMESFSRSVMEGLIIAGIESQTGISIGGIGPIEALKTGIDIEKDYEKFNGKQFIAASGLSLAKLTGSAVLVSKLQKQGQPNVALVIGGSVVLISGLDVMFVQKFKDAMEGKNKKDVKH
jgi:methylmalonyl-CoA mutase cobalamin-binding subunit